MKAFKPLSDAEREVIDKAQAMLSTIPSIPCTSCTYCMEGCPQSIAIQGIFKAMNIMNVYNNLQSAKGAYYWNTKGNNLNGAAECIACGQCEGVCPQHIPIIEELKKAAMVFE
ncbi:MAG: 4Fe-4S dicluster domain-containing protein [Bacteroidota bacterium]|nr:4Fe-4S dicluster domain-containing protein [Bacteroidota bacterium]